MRDAPQSGGRLPCPDTQDLSAFWKQVEAGPLQPWIRQMAQTPQEPKWHGEGDVWTHTRMVCQALVDMPAYQALPKYDRDILFTAALLHDVAKPACTGVVDGEITSPQHTVVGERLARTILWTTFALCGTAEKQQFREAVCALVRNHSVPQHLVDQRDPVLRMRKIASIGILVPPFTLFGLSLLAEADIRGRIAKDQDAKLETLAFFTDAAAELYCLHQPPMFSSPYCRYAVLRGRSVQPEQALFDDTWGPVVMLSGLPGTGKDTYIREHLPDLPMVSLDTIRRRRGISPTQPQGPVAIEAKELARQYLRKRQPFVWNATCLTPVIRARQTDLFAQYGASTQILYLETGWHELLSRNASRAEKVPQKAIEHMLDKLAPPMLHEARDVAWLCNGE
ncbi:MAG TPA: AAA family ATPase [Candidatus Limiplasma sp.]|nr:AAA family ATPase [Candidatus Limiplasma sp.]